MAPRVFLIAAALSLVLAATASATPTWLLPAQDLSAAGGDATDAQVAVDPQGDSFAIWKRNNGTTSTVQVAVRPAGGPWGQAIDLSPPGIESFKQHVGVDPGGNAVATWLEQLGTNDFQVEASTLRQASGPWSAPVPVSDHVHSIFDSNVAVGSRGDAVAIWTESDGMNSTVKASRLASGSAAWSTPKQVSTNATNTQIAVDPLGNAVAVFNVLAAHTLAEGSTLAAGATDWSTPKVLSDTSFDALAPDVAMDPSGNATAVWEQDGAGANHVAYATLAAGATDWGPADRVSADSSTARRVHIVADGAGNFYASWNQNDGTSVVTEAAMKPPSGAWTTPQPLSADGHDASRPDLGVNAAGDSTVVWEHTDGLHLIVQGAVRPAGASSWGPTQDLSVAGQDAHDPRVAVDGQGDATAIWVRSDGSKTITQAAGYDAAGPQFRNLDIPPSGKAFRAVGFGVSPLDVWSPVAGVSWNFGDGGTPVGGPGVANTYTKPGTYTVTLSGVDSLGNASSVQRQILITLPTPALSKVGQSARTWRLGRALPHFSRRSRAHVGTTFRFTLNEPAKVTFVFRHRVTRRHCKGSKRKCTRTVVAGRLSHAGKLGANKLKFQGRFSNRKKLKPGRYTVRITAIDPSNQHSAARTLSFKIVR